MKKIYLLFAICISTLSCTKDEEPAEKAFVPDPTIISEYHELNTDGSISRKCNFDDNGRISELINLGYNQSKYKYNYDSSNRLINISKYNLDGEVLENNDIVYNTDGKVMSIGNRTFSYNPDMMNYVPIDGYSLPVDGNNFYIEDSAYYNPGDHTAEYPNSEQEISINYYIENLEGYISRGCSQYYVYITNPDRSVSGSCYYDFITTYDNNALVKAGNMDSASHYGYDSLTNPLFQGSTNLSYILSFYVNYYYMPNLVSSNNVIIQEYEREDPEHNEYIYEFNENDLPISRTRQYYYTGDLEGQYIDAKYYYQGNVIPE